MLRLPSSSSLRGARSNSNNSQYTFRPANNSRFTSSSSSLPRSIHQQQAVSRSITNTAPAMLLNNRTITTSTSTSTSTSISSSSSSCGSPLLKSWLNHLRYCSTTTTASSTTPPPPTPQKEVLEATLVDEQKGSIVGDTDGNTSTADTSAIPVSNEKIVGDPTKRDFQAETKKILDIVVRSLYTDREVFVRELISNASDALEKFRHKILSGVVQLAPEETLEVNVYTDPKNRVLIIQDNGIGMNEQELVTNLGRIGHSGSAEFLKNLSNAKDSAGIIGQFGVGFYSAFMVASKVTVYSKSAEPDAKGYCWVSDGTGSYEISEAEGVSRGTKIIIALNNEATQFAEDEEIENIIKKYSNFVGFNIKLNNKQVNVVKALWTLPPSQISEKEHNEFFKFISHGYADPLMHMHYSIDSPISIRALFYIAQQNQEKFGLGRMDPGVNLFSRKVLIQAKSKSLMPDYLRFVKGVVDSEDLPLNISREFLQDSNLIRRIKGVLTKRILKWLDEESRKDPKKYEKFFTEFGSFLKEGIVTDFGSKEDLAKLLRFESSTMPAGSVTSLDEYISRMPSDQKEIYYLCAPSRALAESSPYFEGFKANDKEVLFLYSPLDDFVMTNNLLEYKDKKVVSAESSVNLHKQKEGPAEDALNPDEVTALIKWLKTTLESKVSSIKATSRLVGSPAIIVGHDTTAYRRMMKYVDPQNSPALPKQQLEINPQHPLMKKLFQATTAKPKLATVITEQIYDNALVSAGLVDDARTMMNRMNNILSSALNSPSDMP